MLQRWENGVQGKQSPAGTAEPPFVPDGTLAFCESSNPALKRWAIFKAGCTIGQLLAGVAIERPSGNVAVDETFKKAPKAKAKGHKQTEML